LLDFGFGWARKLRLAVGCGIDAWGIEYSVEKRDYAKSFGIRAVKDILELEGKFDIIVFDQVMEHLINPVDVLKEAARYLQPGGIIKIGIPNSKGIMQKLQNEHWGDSAERSPLRPVEPLRHLNCFRLESIDEMANRVGLRRFELPMHVHLQYLNKIFSAKLIKKEFFEPLKRRLFGRAKYCLLTKF
jgi:SAM-dependent methyltransferase